ncbi:cupin domain-containing protein [Bacillus sp. AK128]
MLVKNAQYWIEYLQLLPHPEGGFYKNSYSSQEEMILNDRTRKLYTSIYFLLRSEDISHFHRLKSDELWYFHGGSPLTVHTIDASGKYEQLKLGLNIEQGELPQILVPQNTIFGSSIVEKDSFSLVGCMVAPGFDFEDFELFNQDELVNEHPQHEEIIRKMTYK